MERGKISIDYDRIDVARIMDQIKEKTAAEAGAEAGADTAALGRGPATASGLDLSAGQGRARRVLLKVMSPFSPLIRLLILPVHEELRRTVLILDHTNRRLDELEKERARMDRLQEYTKLLHHLCHNLVIELSKLKIEEETLKTKTRIMEKDFDFLGKRERALEKEVLK
jgi:hypothetical protein